MYRPVWVWRRLWPHGLLPLTRSLQWIGILGGWRWPGSWAPRTRFLPRKRIWPAGSLIAGKGLDWAVETTGDPGLEGEGYGLLTPQGRMVLLAGGAGDGSRSFGVIQGDAVPQRFIVRLIDLWRQGELPVHRLIEVYELADINRAVADMEGCETVKPVLKMD